MLLALSTHWNTFRHSSGEALIDDILDLGFDRVELGYDLTIDLVAGIRAKIESGHVRADSVHSYCPVPIGSGTGHPELFSLTVRDPRRRQLAVRHMQDSIRFAADIGARIVVAHAGRVAMRSYSTKLSTWIEQGKQSTAKFEKTKLKAMLKRDKKKDRHMDALHASLDELMPLLQEQGVTLPLENLPSWEAIPTELEMLDLVERYTDAPIRHWYDTGHAAIREALGFIHAEHWLTKTAPCIAGMHLHEAQGPYDAHIFPLQEKTMLSALNAATKPDTVFVFEPAPGTDPGAIRESAELIRALAVQPRTSRQTTVREPKPESTHPIAIE